MGLTTVQRYCAACDLVILHTAVHHSSTSNYMPNFSEIKETFCGRTDIRTYIYVRMHIDMYMDMYIDVCMHRQMDI